MSQPVGRDGGIGQSTKWASAGTGRQASLKNLWYENTVRVRLPPCPHVAGTQV